MAVNKKKVKMYSYDEEELDRNCNRFFLKVLELIECRPDDTCMTANRNLFHFAHS